MSDRRNESRWVDNLLRPALLAAMMVCLASPVVHIFRWLVPDWNGVYFLAFCFVAGLEGILSERALRTHRITGWNYVASRGAELLVLLLLLKAVNYLSSGAGDLWSGVSLWLKSPESLITPVDYVTGICFLVLWGGAIQVAREVLQLDADERKAPPPADKTSSEYYLWLTQPSPISHRQEALAWLAETFLWGGLAAVTAFGAIHFLLPQTSPPVLPILLYFGLGLAVLSQARFSVAHSGWRVQGLSIQRGITRRWLFWATLFLVGVVCLALLLPARYSLGPVLALLYFLGMVYRLVFSLFGLIHYAVYLLLASLFPGIEEQPPPPAAMNPAFSLEGLEGAERAPWLDIVLSSLFWTVISLIVGYSLIRFLVDRFELRLEADEPRTFWWTRLLGWLRVLFRRWRSRRRGVRDQRAARSALGDGARNIMGGLRFLSLRRLPPRALVRYFFLSTARRAAEAGQPRGPGQTPYEYQASLDEHFDGLEPDLAGLTSAFVRARYSPQPIESHDVDEVKPLWRRLKALLRRHRLTRR
jgi:hypothetical protein